jgi:hypothetical protein
MENFSRKMGIFQTNIPFPKKNSSHFKWQNLAPKDMLIGTIKSTHHGT